MEIAVSLRVRRGPLGSGVKAPMATDGVTGSAIDRRGFRVRGKRFAWNRQAGSSSHGASVTSVDSKGFTLGYRGSTLRDCGTECASFDTEFLVSSALTVTRDFPPTIESLTQSEHREQSVLTRSR